MELSEDKTDRIEHFVKTKKKETLLKFQEFNDAQQNVRETVYWINLDTYHGGHHMHSFNVESLKNSENLFLVSIKECDGHVQAVCVDGHRTDL